MAIALYVPLLVVYSICESFVRFVQDIVSSDASVYTDFQFCKTPLNTRIVKQLQTLREFWPPLWCRGAIMQLFLAIMCPAAEVEYFPEVLRMNDGGDVVLDWASDPSQMKKDSPILIILHGIAGHSKEPYMRRMVTKMSESGWTAVVYNRRGHRDKAGIRSTVEEVVDAEVSELACEVASPRAPEAMELPDIGASGAGPARAQPACLPSPDRQKRPWPIYSDLEDMHEVVQHVISKGNSHVYAIGFSAGSNCLMKYVGETGAQAGLKAAASVANGYDISNGLSYITKNAWMLDRIIAHNLKLLFQKCAKDIDLHGRAKIAAHDVKRCRSVLDIDTVITSRLYQIDVHSYWRSQSCIASVPNTQIPLLCLNAMDDPLIDPTLVVAGHTFARQNENIISVLTSHGGHLGWVQAWRKQWMASAVADYFLAVHAALNKEAKSGAVLGTLGDKMIA